TYAKEPKPEVPAMTCGIKPCIKQGIFAANIKKLFLRNVSIRGQIGEALILQEIDQVSNLI
ncbi:MAG TPA: polygalacturonase, partial [Lachnospiraceae bacterium]|nr:polygalacturonase [Lachnospiraceae bacterium]